MVKIERSNCGVYRIALFWGWAVGFDPLPPVHWFHLHRTYSTGGWSANVAWFHFGRKVDREHWTHYAEADPR